MRRILFVRNAIRRSVHSHSPTFYRARDFAQQKNNGIYFTELIQETKKQTQILEDIRTTLQDIHTTTEDIQTELEDIRTTAEDIQTTAEDIQSDLEDIGATTEDIGTTAKSSNDAVLCIVAILAKDLK
jgi:hypothetical protein